MSAKPITELEERMYRARGSGQDVRWARIAYGSLLMGQVKEARAQKELLNLIQRVAHQQKPAEELAGDPRLWAENRIKGWKEEKAKVFGEEGASTKLDLDDEETWLSIFTGELRASHRFSEKDLAAEVARMRSDRETGLFEDFGHPVTYARSLTGDTALPRRRLFYLYLVITGTWAVIAISRSFEGGWLTWQNFFAGGFILLTWASFATFQRTQKN